MRPFLNFSDELILTAEEPWAFFLLCAAAVLLIVLAALFLIRRIKMHASSAVYEDLDGIQFEEYCADLLKKNGYQEVELTSASADFGVDIFAEKDGITYAFQCKLYERPVGTRAVQEIYSGRDFYHCMVGIVLSNQTFTSGAMKMAEAFNILLWGGDELKKLEKSGRKT